MNKIAEKKEVKELKKRFTLLFKNETAKDFLSELIDYLRFIEDTHSLKTVALKILTNKPSGSISAISSFYRGLRSLWGESYDVLNIVWADMHSPFVGRPSRHGFPMVFSDLQYARSATRLFHERLLLEINQATRAPYLEDFDQDRGILVIDGIEILVGKKIGVENNQIRLLATLMKDPSKTWFTDELIEDWDEFGAGTYDVPRNRFYDPAHKLNKTIEIATGINDFIEYTTKKININPSYLKRE